MAQFHCDALCSWALQQELVSVMASVDLFVTYLGELALSPIGLSAFSRYSPKSTLARCLVCGLASAIGGVLAGLLGGDSIRVLNQSHLIQFYDSVLSCYCRADVGRRLLSEIDRLVSLRKAFFWVPPNSSPGSKPVAFASNQPE